jgi:hypothetical protein
LEFRRTMRVANTPIVHGDSSMKRAPNLDQGNPAAKPKNSPGPLAKSKRTNLARTAPMAKARNTPSPYAQEQGSADDAAHPSSVPPRDLPMTRASTASSRAASARTVKPHPQRAVVRERPSRRCRAQKQQLGKLRRSRCRSGGVSSAIKTSGLLARDTNQAMNRRMKLNDALGKLTGAAK